MSGDRAPLQAIQTLEAAAFRMGQLARRLLADYSDAGLTVADTCVFGHGDGDGSSQLKLKAGDLDKARAVGAALGMEVHSRFTDHGLPMEHVSGEITLDGIDVSVRAYRSLSPEEAAAWRAEQDQAAAEEPQQAPGDAE